MQKDYYSYWRWSLLLSIPVFLLILYGLVNLKNSTEVSINSSDEINITIPSDKEIYRQVFRDIGHQCSSSQVNCKQLIQEEIKKRKLKYQQVDKTKIDSNFISYILDTNYLILIIYVLLTIALNFQFSTIWYIKSEQIDNLDKIFIDISDWAINSPPILGVLGTIVSFSILVAQGGDIEQSFSKSFFDAALTTIAGGFIYIINLFLKIFIFKHISSK